MKLGTGASKSGCRDTVTVLGAETALLPLVFMAVKVTIYVPGSSYTWLGFCCPLSDAKFPSPKSQFHPVGIPVDVSLNVTVRGAIPSLGVRLVNEAEGGVIGVSDMFLKDAVELRDTVGNPRGDPAYTLSSPTTFAAITR
jgi:hypothetical protein